MANISQFLANMSGGGARPNQFRVELNFPAVLGTIARNARNESQFLCHATSLPSSDIGDIPLGFRGRPVHFAGERSFNPWSVSIYNDTNFTIRNAFEQWSNYIVRYASTDGRTNPTGNGSNGYMTDLTVTQLDRNDQPLKKYYFYNAYPQSIGSINLSYNLPEIETFDVTFIYNYFETSEVGGAPGRNDNN